MISIGRMAEKYGMLPSQIAEHATTYDIMITDVLATYDSYQQQKQSGKLVDATAYGYSKDDLKNMMETSRVKHS
jgi:hypothetical protein